VRRRREGGEGLGRKREEMGWEGRWEVGEGDGNVFERKEMGWEGR
jgi:hypothetical protein